MTNNLINLICPKNIYCICCGDSIDGTRLDSLCFSCRKKITWIADNPYERLMDDFCIDEILACCLWGYYPRKFIREFKNGARYMADPLGQMMAERYMASGIEADAIVYIPSDKRKENSVRGFNPARLLAEKVSKVTKLPVYNILIKADQTKSNRASDKHERETNTLGVFEIDEKAAAGKSLQNGTLLLIDDIITTGSTADGASRVLKNWGAKKIVLLCFASSTGSTLYDEL